MRQEDSGSNHEKMLHLQNKIYFVLNRNSISEAGYFCLKGVPILNY